MKLDTAEKRARLLAKKAEYRLRIGHKPRYKTAAESLWDRIDKSGDCWLWTGVPQATGYAHVVFRGKTIKAHRLSWELANGPIPPNLCVCHRCDVRLCVNPAHLFLGTLADNNADRAAKGRTRTNPARGTDVKGAKLNHVTAAWARELRAKGYTQKVLARVFGVSQSAIVKAARGATWGTK